MSFTASLVSLRFPMYANGSDSWLTSSVIWIGDKGTPDEGYYIFKCAISSSWIMSKTLMPSMQVTGTIGTLTLTPAYSPAFGGYVYWASGNYALFYSMELSIWTMHNNSGRWGVALDEMWRYDNYVNITDNSTGSYVGAAWWTQKSGSSFPYYLDASAMTMQERGGGRGKTLGIFGGSELSVIATWEYWEGGVGELTAKGTASGTKIFGLPQWKNGTSLYTRSVMKNSSTSKYSYGSIAWNSTAGKYILGSYGSASGWNESASAPTTGNSWTLAFAKPSDSTVTGSSVTLSYVGYVLGSESEETYIFDMARWRRI